MVGFTNQYEDDSSAGGCQCAAQNSDKNETVYHAFRSVGKIRVKRGLRSIFQNTLGESGRSRAI